MITVNSLQEIPRNCRLAIQQPDGTWLCYMPTVAELLAEMPALALP